MPDVLPPEQAPGLPQIGPVGGRKPATGCAAIQRCYRSPENGHTVGERRTAFSYVIGECGNLDRVACFEGVGEYESNVDIADVLTEATVRQTANRVHGHEAGTPEPSGACRSSFQRALRGRSLS